MSKLVAVSLFSGCGGSDIGAKKAGVEVIFANDNDADSIATFLKYIQLTAKNSTKVIKDDIANIKKFPECDLLIGCYPCQSFTMGGPRSPDKDPRSKLYLEFKRCLEQSKPKFFVTENVAGMAWLNGGEFLTAQLECFRETGKGYNISVELLNAKDYGVPQDRKRVFIIGVRKDLDFHYWFPQATHGDSKGAQLDLEAHGEAIANLPVDAENEYYDYPPKPFSWWYMSRNRKRRWEEPSYAILANWSHAPLHPASPSMKMIESNLKDGFKQKWKFQEEYDHLEGHQDRPKLIKPRRLSWRECAAIQTFPPGFDPVGNVASKFRQIGNATPPLLMEVIVRGITHRTAFQSDPYKPKVKSLIKCLA